MLKEIQDFIDSLTGKKEVKEQLDSCNTKVVDYQHTIKLKLAYITELEKTDGDKANTIIELQTQFEDMQKRYLDLEREYELLNGEEVSVPKFLDQSKLPYVPVIQYLDEHGKLNSVEITNPRDLYPLYDFAKRILKEQGIETATKYTKLMAIWNWVVSKKVLVYISDYGDNWQPAVLTYYRKEGDCEDGTILFIILCRAANIRADEVFNAVGPCSFGYHSYPIAYINEADCIEAKADKSKVGWYVFETTLDYEQTSPSALKDSKTYFIDTGGLQNWKFAGQIISTYSKLFNLKTDSQYPGAKEKKIDNTVKKVKKIREIWKTENGDRL